ncbi:D-alanyl-D-alanine carboxypeptidase family protein [Streptomyces sp. NBC_01190]|uniref:D-alanyl-D-alanine carboxypeptidase family protein n=1 Tax=Streptomyces sp. NBC_01190 TaxID=2903767 RepID=UPI00386C1BEC|nr:D-alanyl-D-alanine carboxypeptidase [Streptomyces sp. NBC_01190]
MAALPAAAAAGGGPRSAGSLTATPPSSGASSADSSALSEPGVQVRPEDGTPDLPANLSALSWTVSDAGTGEVLAAKDAHRELPPASTLKTLFALTVLPRFPRARTHRVTDDELADVGPGSSLVGVQAGQTYTVADLWRGVFLSSGNDAVHVLAHMNGSVALTVSQMQAKARLLGADDTHVVSPDGYDEPGQVSSAYDLAVFGRVGLTDPDFAEYVSTATAQFPGGYDAHGDYVESFGIQNTNRLLTGANGVTPYPGVIGVKNGYTTNAGNTLIAAARRDGRTLIVTVMNPQSGLPQAVYHEATELLDWGFAAAGRTGPVGSLGVLPAAAVQGTPAHAPAGPAGAPGAPGAAEVAGPPPAAVPHRAAAAASPTASPTSRTSGSADPANSTTAWYVGGALVLAAAVSVLVLRKRGTSARPR